MEIDQKKIERMLYGIHPVNKLHVYKAIVNSHPERFCKYQDRFKVAPYYIVSVYVSTISVCGYSAMIFRHIPCLDLYDVFYSIKISKNEPD